MQSLEPSQNLYDPSTCCPGCSTQNQNYQLHLENNWLETERHRMYPEVITENGWKKVAYYFPEYAKRPRKRQRIK